MAAPGHGPKPAVTASKLALLWERQPPERQRFLRFAVVGASGVLINFAFLTLGLWAFSSLGEHTEAAASALGILGLLDDLKMRLHTDWPDLAALPGMQGPDAVAAWIEGARFDGTDFETSILDHVAALATDGTGGAGSEAAGEAEK